MYVLSSSTKIYHFQATYFNTHLTILTWSFYKQEIFKQILTEGERLILTFVPLMSFIEQVCNIYEKLFALLRTLMLLGNI